MTCIPNVVVVAVVLGVLPLIFTLGVSFGQWLENMR